MLQAGSNISVRGILPDIAVHEDIASIELESLTYLPPANFSNTSNQSSPGGKTKRQLIAENRDNVQSQDTIDTGRPMKKTKSGTIGTFIAEGLGAGGPSTSSTGSSSGSNAESSESDAENSGSNVKSSYGSQVDGSPLSKGASSACMTCNAELISGPIAVPRKDGMSTKKA